MKNEKKGSGISLGRIWSQYSFIFVLVIIMIGYAFTIQANGNTFNFGHIAAILSSQNTVIVGTIALGMAFVIITGQIDLSVGSSLVLCTGATIVVFNVTNSIPLMILTALAVGALCGAINGLLVGFGKMPPFVVTLGTMLIYRSLTLSVVRKIDPIYDAMTVHVPAQDLRRWQADVRRLLSSLYFLRLPVHGDSLYRDLQKHQVRQEHLCRRLQ